MSTRRAIVRAVTPGIIAALVTSVVPAETAVAATGTSAVAVMRTAGGVAVGEVILTQRGAVVTVQARVSGLTPGFHGFHVHSTGTCVAPFTSAGGHLGPAGATVPNYQGDMPPLLAGSDGIGRASFDTERFTVSELFDADGASVIVHAGADNFANLPSRYGITPDATTLSTGDAGGRVLCGTVTADDGAAHRGGYWLTAADGGVFAYGDAPFFGSMGGRPLSGKVVSMAATPSGQGYWLAATDGGVFAYGDAPFLGSMGGRPLAAPVVGIAAPSADAVATVRDSASNALGTVTMARENNRTRLTVRLSGLTPGFHGFHVHTTGTCVAPFTSAGGHLGPAGATVPNYAGDMVSLYADRSGVARASFTTDRFSVAELFDADGASVIVHAGADNFANIPTRYGVTPDATTLATGDAGGRIGCGPVVPTGGTRTAGYWLAAADGGVFAFGDAPFLGSMAGTKLAAPIVAIASTPTGAGYWLAAADGGVFAFGDAAQIGSMVGRALGAPIASMAATSTGRGYWLVARDGGTFAFGDANFGGRPNDSAASIAASGSSGGYRVVSRTGNVFAYGDTSYEGARQAPSGDIVCILSRPTP